MCVPVFDDIPGILMSSVTPHFYLRSALRSSRSRAELKRTAGGKDPTAHLASIGDMKHISGIFYYDKSSYSLLTY